MQRRVAVLMFERAGCRVDAVASGAEMLRRLSGEVYEFAVASLHLPDFPGPDLAAAIREQEGRLGGDRPPVRLVGLGGAAGVGEVPAGFEAVLAQPLTLAAVQALGTARGPSNPAR